MSEAKRGFALLTPERHREIAAMGGAAVPARKRSFAADPEYAQRAGAKGGRISRGGGRQKNAKA